MTGNFRNRFLENARSLLRERGESFKEQLRSVGGAEGGKKYQKRRKEWQKIDKNRNEQVRK